MIYYIQLVIYVISIIYRALGVLMEALMMIKLI